ncbi:MAG: L-threonylcarbamoyladenylate synthase [Actinomycetota bacterium]|nr:L-threonylcarbamoyladenylate synthase [Actinomycetota bacterium]
MTDPAAVARALVEGGVAVIPTDTVYGLAASPGSPAAIDAIFDLKGRDRAKALPVLGADVDALASIVDLDERAMRLAATFWPGPLTIVLPRAAGFDVDLGIGSEVSVAVRVPQHDLARELLSATGPLAVTSANLSDAPPASSVDEARAIFGDRVAAYLDGGRCDGAPSTIVSLVGEPHLVRQGALDADTVLAGVVAS